MVLLDIIEPNVKQTGVPEIRIYPFVFKREELEGSGKVIRLTPSKKHTFYKGRLIHTQKFKEYSDRMLELEVKRRMPEYRERQEVTHSGDVRFVISFEGDNEPTGEIVDGQYRALDSGT